MPAAIPDLRHRASGFALAHGAGARVSQNVALAISEAVTNAVKYAYAAEDHGTVTLAASVSRGSLVLRVSDHGRGFQPGSSDGLGLGQPIIAEVAADLEIVQGAGGTELRMSFLLAPDG